MICKCRVCKSRITMRTAPSQKTLRDWLHIIGNGLHQAGANAEGQSNELLIPNDMTATQLDDIINFCYPQEFFADPSRNVDCITESAILCPTNAEVAEINNTTINRMVGDARIYDSIDQPLGSGDPYDTYRAAFNLEAIHNETSMGMPQHRLVLKVDH